MKKQILLSIFLVLSAITATAQTLLMPGDVAIVQVNYSYQYSFDFVVLKDLEAGTQIWFTDYAYSNSLKHLNETTSSDGRYLYTAPDNIEAGTVIQSAGNTNIVKSGSSLNFRSFRDSYSLTGENLIAYQVNNSDTTYLTAFGWMRQNNFAPGATTEHKYSDIPPGLSFSNHTVVQMDSIFGITDIKRDFKYNYNYSGTADKIREWLSKTSNYSTAKNSSNTPVSKFTVMPLDSVKFTLEDISPAHNESNVSVKTDVKMSFTGNGTAEVKKDIIVRNLSTQSTSYILSEEMLVSDESVTELTNKTVVSFSLANRIEPSQTYAIEIPSGAIESEYGGKFWPQNDTVIHFSTSSSRSYVNVDFSVDKRENCHWTTDSVKERYGDFYLYGYWDFEIKGIPMRFYTNEYSENGSSPNKFNTYGYNDYLFLGGRLVVNLSKIENTITGVWSELYENNCAIITNLYSNGSVISSRTITGSNQLLPSNDGMYHVPQFIQIDDNNKIDSIEYLSPEGIAYKMQIELIDLAAPRVDLGDDIKICRGDSTLLDAGFIPGAEYMWSNNATTSKIWVKETGDYHVTVKNTLGQAKDTIKVEVLEPIVTILPDTIYACVGDTVTLNAGGTDYGYFWSVRYPQDTPIRKVTESGLYQVIISNSACMAIDSVRVIFQGAKLDVFFNQGGMCGANDVQGELYRREQVGMFNVFTLYESKNMPQMVQFDSLPAGEYLFKAHFVSYSFVGENPFIDTYNGGEATWSTVTPFTLTCTTDTTISFSLASKPSAFEFVGTGTIAGQVIMPSPNLVRGFGAPSNISTFSNILIMLYDGTGTLIATTSPDANGFYSFTNLPAGTYSVSVEHTGYSLQSVFSTNLSEGASVSNANFSIEEESHTIVQGISTEIGQISDNDVRVTLLPNRILTSAQLAITSNTADRATVTLYDMTGRVCNHFQMNLVAGKNETTITKNGIKGLYLLKVATSEKTTTLRVIFE